MAEIFILYGESGDYDAHGDWPVAAYTDEADANGDCEALNALVPSAITKHNALGWQGYEEALAELRALDPGAALRDGWLKYAVYSLELRDKSSLFPTLSPSVEAD